MKIMTFYLRRKIKFASYILLSCVYKVLLDEHDTIEMLESPEYSRVLGEMTQKQKDIYASLGIKELS